MTANETIAYEDGAHAPRTATIEGDGTTATLVLDVQGRTVRVPIDTTTSDPGGAIAQNVSTSIAVTAYALLGALKKWGATYGTRIAFQVDGRRLVALYQEHPPDRGKDYAHPGVTLLEPTAALSAAPPAPASAAASPTTAAPWFVTGIVVAGVAVTCFAVLAVVHSTAGARP